MSAHGSTDKVSGIEALHDHVAARMELQQTVDWVAALAVRELAISEFAVVVLSGPGSQVPRGPRINVRAASDPVALDLFEFECAAADGPCLDTLDTGATNAVERTSNPGAKWQGFRAACLRQGVVGALFVPLEAGGVRVGALGLYSESTHSYSAAQVDVAEAFAAAAAVALKNTSDYWVARTHTDTLAGSLESRAVIEQAKGILMHTLLCGPEEAFGLLSEQSQFENRKIREICAEIVALTAASDLPGRTGLVNQWVRARMTRYGGSIAEPESDAVTVLVDLESGSFTARSLVDHGRHVIQIGGELDASASVSLLNVICSGPGAAEVDMSALTFMDCAGYRALVAAWRELPESESVLRIRHARDQPRRLLDLLGHLQLAHPDIHVA